MDDETARRAPRATPPGRRPRSRAEFLSDMVAGPRHEAGSPRSPAAKGVAPDSPLLKFPTLLSGDEGDYDFLDQFDLADFPDSPQRGGRDPLSPIWNFDPLAGLPPPGRTTLAPEAPTRAATPVAPAPPLFEAPPSERATFEEDDDGNFSPGRRGSSPKPPPAVKKAHGAAYAPGAGYARAGCHSNPVPHRQLACARPPEPPDAAAPAAPPPPSVASSYRRFLDHAAGRRSASSPPVLDAARARCKATPPGNDEVAAARVRPPARAEPPRTGGAPPAPGASLRFRTTPSWRAQSPLLATLPFGGGLCMLLRESTVEPPAEARVTFLQEILLMLWHSSRCKSQQGQCLLRPGACANLGQLFEHSWSCDAASCEYRHFGCPLIRRLLAHYKECSHKDCELCVPVRNSIIHKLGSDGATLSRSP